MIRSGARGLRTLTALCVLLLCGEGTARAADCLDCHAGAVEGRTDVKRALNAASHHVQGVAATGRQCYACHWEATPDGRIDEQYHAGTATAGHTGVDLVIWGVGIRPQVYRLHSTAVTYAPAAIGSPGERTAVAGITGHCLGCHSDRNNDTPTFAGDSHTPRQYAWDRQSVAARYSRTETAAWGKYSTLAGRGKSQVTKALSAHGNARANQGGWSAATGYDGAIPATRGGARARNVECFDCHNSHGSAATGITSSYRAAGGAFNGGILKETRAGTGGYRMDYRPAANPDREAVNPYNAGAALCFDCHETADAGATPWGYRATFGADQPIIGFKDTPRFGPGLKGSTARYASRQGHTAIASSHLKAGRFLDYSAAGRINGLCTPCHDPHGVSPTLGENASYALPLLKGTWLTSPYREDAPPRVTPGKGGFAGRDAGGNVTVSWEKGGQSGAAAERQQGMSYNLDRNTFGPNAGITEKDDRFAGLCLQCHKKEGLTAKSRSGRMHRAVKGWGANREHAFPCAKCHQPHNSGLPRLMQTNCLNAGPAGLREPEEVPWSPEQLGPAVQKKDDGSETATRKTPAREQIVGCHVRQRGRTTKTPGPTSKKPNDAEWNGVTKW